MWSGSGKLSVRELVHILHDGLQQETTAVDFAVELLNSFDTVDGTSIPRCVAVRGSHTGLESVGVVHHLVHLCLTPSLCFALLCCALLCAASPLLPPFVKSQCCSTRFAPHGELRYVACVCVCVARVNGMHVRLLVALGGLDMMDSSAPRLWLAPSFLLVAFAVTKPPIAVKFHELEGACSAIKRDNFVAAWPR